MEVVNKKKTICFGNLKEGECFAIGGDLYIKMEDIVTEFAEYNALRLTDGMPTHLFGENKVMRSNAKIVEED